MSCWSLFIPKIITIKNKNDGDHDSVDDENDGVMALNVLVILLMTMTIFGDEVDHDNVDDVVAFVDYDDEEKNNLVPPISF